MRATATVVFLTNLLFAAAGDPARNAAQVMPGLAGEWHLISTADEQRTDVGNQAIKMVVEEDGHVHFTFASSTTNRGIFTPMPSPGKVEYIDLKLSDEKVLQGVCRLVGDDLVFCFAAAGSERPGGLLPTGTQWAERWRREQRGAGRAPCSPGGP
jgi:hypothetical protein